MLPICLMAIEKGYSSDDIQLLAPMYKGENGIDNLNKKWSLILNDNINKIIYYFFRKCATCDNVIYLLSDNANSNNYYYNE